MKCPVILTKESPEGELLFPTQGECLKEECAWYHQENQCCSVLTIAQGSVYLHKALLNLNSEIPLGGNR